VRAVVRFTCALAIAGSVLVLARTAIAAAILARGDDAARAGRLADAASYYDRARTVGGDTFEELERYALLALLSPSGRVPAAAMRSANGFLRTNAGSGPGYFDRGLIEWRAGSFDASARDFRLAWKLGGDPRAATFARSAGRRARRIHR
jgi:hypothetical protein